MGDDLETLIDTYLLSLDPQLTEAIKTNPPTVGCTSLQSLNKLAHCNALVPLPLVLTHPYYGAEALWHA